LCPIIADVLHEGLQGLSQYHPQTTGTETIDGKLCLVVEYTVQGLSTKAWIWQEYGFPLKVVTETAQGTTMVEYKNIDFSGIPDSEFQLPPGVQIMDMPAQP
jgi:outer membrane lipoprotein-sorting protein